MTTTPPPSHLSVPGTSHSSLSVPGTPFKTDGRTIGQYEPQYHHRPKVLEQFSYDMSPYFVGPIPPKTFLDKFLPLPSRPPVSEDGPPVPEDGPPVPEDHIFTPNMFSALKAAGIKGPESTMFPGLSHDVVGFIPDLTLIKSENRTDSKAASTTGIGFKLDCIVLDRRFTDANPDLITRPDISLAEFFIEFKARSSSYDPFRATATPSSPTHPSPYPEDVFMSLGAGEASKVLGQMTAYAMLVLSTQYRTHTFSVLIVKDRARLLRWDRGGAVVTESFPYDDESYLFDFFFRYNHAGSAVRGHDITVRKATDGELRDAKAKVVEFEKENRLLTVSVKQQDFVIRAPCAQPEIPVGRWTRTSVAYDCQNNQRVFFKDSWRVSHPEVTPEGDIYTMLENKNVPNVPVCLARGDVGNETYHSTRTHEFVKFTNKPASNTITHYRHYRLVLDTVGRELTSFTSSKELVTAIRASLVAHEAAVKACVLHRDISPGNIMIVDKECNPNMSGGMLIDWDHSKPIKPVPGQARQHARTGTWQFMAAALVENPELPHTWEHDLESFFWVLVWVVVSYMRTDWDEARRSSFLKETMNPRVYLKRGGTGKREYLRAISVPDVTRNKYIHHLLQQLIKLFAAQYPVEIKEPPPSTDIVSVIHQATGNEAPPESDPNPLEKYFRENFSHETIWNLIDALFARPNWPTDDCADPQSKAPSEDELRGMLAGSARSRSHAEEIGVFVPSL